MKSISEDFDVYTRRIQFETLKKSRIGSFVKNFAASDFFLIHQILFRGIFLFPTQFDAVKSTPARHGNRNRSRPDKHQHKTQNKHENAQPLTPR